MLPIFTHDTEYSRTSYRFLNIGHPHKSNILIITLEPSLLILDTYYRMDEELIQPIELVTELQRGRWFKISS